MLAYVLAIVVILVAALIAFGIAALLHLQGAAYIIFVVVLLLIGIAAAGTILVFHYRARKEKELEGESSGKGNASDLDLLLNDANRKLRTSQQGSKTLEALPLIYILGDAGAAKTSTVMQSGLDPELVVGSAASTSEQTPTQILNLWFSNQAVLLEVGTAIRENNSLFERLIHRTRAKAYRSAFGMGAAPRAAIVCVSMDQLLVADGGTSVMASARATGAQLREVSRLLGLPVAVYVFVTKLDRIPHFDKYAHNLSEDEVRQILGSPLPRSEASVGTYADQASKMLAGVVDGLVYQLGEFRVEMLDRENDPRNSAGVYEFPREFGKVRKVLNQYLVELCKPSQLSANPYLRGVYFTGVRARVVERAVATPAAAERAVPQDAGATQYLRISSGQTGFGPRAAATPAMVSSRIPQWTFLPRLLTEVVFGDKRALASSRQSTPARLFRRILFGTLAFLFALYFMFLVVSYLNNAAIEHRIASDARALPNVDATAVSMPSLTDLHALEDLRQTIVLLDGYQRDGAPWRYRFGLYQGEKLDAKARRIYFDRFRPMLLNPAQANMITFMRALPDAPAASAANDSNSYNAAYNPLKAYLITTSHPEKSQTAFLTPVLLQNWKGSNRVEEEPQRLASKQFDFYGNELLRTPPYGITPDPPDPAVDHARSYLSNFLVSTRIYQAMLTDADKASQPIDFNKQYPGSANFVVDPHIVRGAFTHDGFAAMQEALKHPERYANGEAWVLGAFASKSLGTTAGSKDSASLYTEDFLKEWHEFLISAHLTNCGSLQEAPARLNFLAGPSSPLLELFFTVSHNTAVANPQIKSTFQPAQVLVDPNATDRLIGPGVQPYLTALLQLAGAVDLAAKTPNITTDANAFAPVSIQIVAATGAAQQTAQAFNPDPITHTDQTVLSLLQAPIQCVSRFEPSPGAAGNGAGLKVCEAINPLLSKFPFAFSPNTTGQASLQAVDAAFAPETGAVASTYNAMLNKILIKASAGYSPAPSAPGKVNPKFLYYFNHAEHVSSVLYAGGAKSATMSFTLRFIPGNGVANAALLVDGQRVPASSAAQPSTWTASTAQKASLIYDNTEVLPFQGTWSLFELVRTAQITRTAGGFRLEYPIDTATTVAGHKVNGSGNAVKTVTFELSGPGAEFLAGEGLSGLGCVQPVILK